MLVNLLVATAAAVILAVVGVTAVVAAVNPSAGEVASRIDPLAPPDFYGVR
ncbi:hypothetical protein AMIS_19310 [Actinoplanes missouriensis 431]|uniref:Uncharacterized protein n=1 Tax=Actinoplanes missouriensis (strain ATCC 14538 / DSM 43046 / CBS 188.64 / JCM 3121 / NBRC 102363 / NCIMB 12654 / NRRL B-3342 / UNCC 431) TaxID=512565 RepID=I0H2B4_ACTM4|nr:hypothetical protein [Actinoplanes missouriensis]BAL87151.1 hypothetical protein AMIS_19310 [Actinoplanes missouriensis 431]